MSPMRPEVDLCVIGGGEAGFSMALAGAALGLKVTLVQAAGSEPCWRNWDVTLDVLRQAGRRADQGAEPDPATIRGFQAQLDAAMQRAAPDRRLARLEVTNVRIVRGTARFTDPRTIAVGGEAIRARRFVIATGAAAPDRQPGPLLTLEQLRTLTGLDTNLQVNGGDARSLALAQGLNRLGVPTAIRAPAGLLPAMDPELVEPLRRSLVRAGIRLLAPDEPAEPPAGTSLTYAAETTPVLAKLDLGRGAISFRDGALVLSRALRTTNARVYALGGVSGAFSSQAVQAQVGVVLRAAFFRLPARFDPHAVPACTITDPGIAAVGLSEAAARDRGPITVWRWPLSETQAGWARGSTEGLVKVVADRGGRVLGAGIVGSEAAEQIGYWALAVRAGLTLQQIDDVALPIPALAEASRRLVTLHTAARLRNPWLKRALSVLSRFG